MTTVELTVTGMHCASCAALIEEVLTEQPGLRAAQVDLDAARARVTFDDTVTDLGAVQAVIAELGYGSSPVGDPGAVPPP
ncbi:MAG TPA: heavy-metal-associated domain-containing protein [Acidimicrobiales bacterium]|nr:heavy-metal-associated domain-containing protein [Acidimicrobiales bacterium]